MDKVYQGRHPLWNREDTRLAFFNREGIWTAKPGGEPQLFLPCEGVTGLLQWQGKEIVFTERDGDKVIVAKTAEGEKEILTSVAAVNTVSSELRERQEEADQGHKASLLDPKQVAREFLNYQLEINPSRALVISWRIKNRNWSSLLER